MDGKCAFQFLWYYYYGIVNISNTMGATSGAGIVHCSEAPEFTCGIAWGSGCSILVFVCSVLETIDCIFVFCLFWTLHSLSFFYLLPLLTFYISNQVL